MSTDAKPATQPETKFISIQEAIVIAKQHGIAATTATMIHWVETNKLGHQPGGINAKWYVDDKKFREFIIGGMNGKNRGTQS